MITTSPDSNYLPPSIPGLELTDDEWRLNPEEYEQFITATTGVSPTADLDASDCYRIGNRLEGFLETRKRNEEWTDTVGDTHPDIESVDEVLALARFFRQCHDCCLDSS